MEENKNGLESIAVITTDGTVREFQKGMVLAIDTDTDNLVVVGGNVTGEELVKLFLAFEQSINEILK